jgi:hypothetical protein
MASTTAVSHVPPCEHLPAAFGLGRAPRYTGRGSDSPWGGMCPWRAPAGQRPGNRCPPNRETSTERAYLGLPKLSPQQKGGDPVSHCPSPRSPASVSWILASMGVRAV